MRLNGSDEAQVGIRCTLHCSDPRAALQPQANFKPGKFDGLRADEEDHLRHELLPLCAPQLGCAFLSDPLGVPCATLKPHALCHIRQLSAKRPAGLRGAYSCGSHCCRRLLFGRDFRAHMEGAAMLEAALPKVPMWSPNMAGGLAPVALD